VQDGTVSERLASLDGSGREFIRNGGSLACYLPDKRTVVVEQRPAPEPLVGFPAVNEQTANFYDIKEVARTRLNRRDTHVITVTPKDEFRYGYRLWIDDSTAMPLKTQLCDSQGQVIEQILFARLDMPENIPDSDLAPTVHTDGMRWVRQGSSVDNASAALAAYRASQLPPGFRLTLQGAQTLGGAAAPASHLVYSDGLATVSVFVEEQGGTAAGVAATADSQTQPPMQGLARVGSGYAFSTIVQGHQVTAVGEVPAQTVEFIAHSVKIYSGGELPRH
jgi:sigma-E factor negative regulatory protein RseB